MGFRLGRLSLRARCLPDPRLLGEGAPCALRRASQPVGERARPSQRPQGRSHTQHAGETPSRQQLLTETAWQTRAPAASTRVHVCTRGVTPGPGGLRGRQEAGGGTRSEARGHVAGGARLVPGALIGVSRRSRPCARSPEAAQSRRGPWSVLCHPATGFHDVSGLSSVLAWRASGLAGGTGMVQRRTVPGPSSAWTGGWGAAVEGEPGIKAPREPQSAAVRELSPLPVVPLAAALPPPVSPPAPQHPPPPPQAGRKARAEREPAEGVWAQVSGSRTLPAGPRVRAAWPWWATWSVAQGGA